jgi:hypothetical protein
MADTQKYKVLRRMDGDRLYEPGDVREMMAADAKHLLDLGVLEPVDGKAEKGAEKAEPAPANKAEPPPANKAEPITTTRAGAGGPPVRRGRV